MLFVALASISLLAYAAGALARRLRQPAVIGEVALGVLLGPTLLNGALSDTLFPADIRPFLTALANIGVALFMFAVGAELDAGLLRGRRVVAGTVAAGSIALPFLLGALLALHLHAGHPTDDRAGFVLFMGAAMSVTAFPVLARILTDRGMQRTWLGAVALACAAIDDVLAWTLLAVVVAIIGAGGGSQWLLLLLVPYVVLMFTVVRPLLRRFLEHRRRADPEHPGALVVTLVGLLSSAAFTEWIGLHFIFGAFIFGAVMPRPTARCAAPDVTGRVRERLSYLNDLLLLPLFFVVAGLKVDLSGMNGAALVELGLILAVAVGGKFAGAFLAARATGMKNRPATALALLINTRGLTELVILTVGLQLGALDGELYSTMVVMALVTTAMAGPLLQLVYPVGRAHPALATSPGPRPAGGTAEKAPSAQAAPDRGPD
ncbi:cation:proton antiporter [Streptomyces lienomycini]|uniref:Cation:proton antiporter n=2 Tax=Streptomyces TaxID=1883 RepID=A0ABV9WPV8_9ACTN|nr:cation:proton antiporter [Streptomyces lienomycini]